MIEAVFTLFGIYVLVIILNGALDTLCEMFTRKSKYNPEDDYTRGKHPDP